MKNIVVALSIIFLLCSLSFAEPPEFNAQSYGAWQREQLLKKKRGKDKSVAIDNGFDFQKHKISAAEAAKRITDNSTKISDLTTATQSRIDALNQKLTEEAAKPYPNEYVLVSLQDQIHQEQKTLRELSTVRSISREEYLGGYRREYRGGYWGGDRGYR